MDNRYYRLKDRVQRLGNHHRKYLLNIERNLETLIDRLESRAILDQVYLWKVSESPAEQMQFVVDSATNLRERLTLLGTYYALQFLQLNVRAVDVLMLNVTARPDLMQVYREFMATIGADFRSLLAAYMRRLLDAFYPDPDRSHFAICSVGTKADQDDIDLGIIDDGWPGRGDLNRAVGRMAGEMLKRACRPHLHLSDRVGAQSFSASLTEYHQLLKVKIQDYIIISEMLNATLLLGNQELFDNFRRRITGRYYCYGRPNRFHEGYLCVNGP